MSEESDSMSSEGQETQAASSFKMPQTLYQPTTTTTAYTYGTGPSSKISEAEKPHNYLTCQQPNNSQSQINFKKVTKKIVKDIRRSQEQIADQLYEIDNTYVGEYSLFQFNLKIAGYAFLISLILNAVTFIARMNSTDTFLSGALLGTTVTVGIFSLISLGGSYYKLKFFNGLGKKIIETLTDYEEDIQKIMKYAEENSTALIPHSENNAPYHFLNKKNIGLSPDSETDLHPLNQNGTIVDYCKFEKKKSLPQVCTMNTLFYMVS